MGRELSTRALNRALLARQGLLARRRVSAARIVGAAGGLQSQEPRDAYIALFARQAGFTAARYEQALARGELIRGSWLRCTIHTVPREDYLALRPTLDRVISPPGYQGRDVYAELDINEVATAASELLADGTPRTARQIGEALQPQFPSASVDSLAYGARFHLRVVMPHVPGARWGYPRPPVLAPAETALGEPLAATPAAADLLLRGIAAIGPCSLADLRTWSGLTGIRESLEPVLGGLTEYRDAAGRVLYDVPSAPRPRASTPAPVRFLGEFDNSCLSHASRERIIDPADAAHFAVAKNGRRDLTVLIDGFVGATWRIELSKQAATLSVAPFAPLPSAAAEQLRIEALGLARMLEPDAATHAVRIVAA